MSLAKKLQTMIEKFDFWFGLKFKPAKISYSKEQEAVIVTKGYCRRSDIIKFANEKNLWKDGRVTSLYAREIRVLYDTDEVFKNTCEGGLSG